MTSRLAVCAWLALAAATPALAGGEGPDRDGDGIADALEALFLTDPNDPDTDGDGLLDGWEVEGVDRGALSEPLHLHGAHPLRKDVFVEIDWMRDAKDDATPNAIVAWQVACDIARLFRESGTGLRVRFDLGPDIRDIVPRELQEAERGDAGFDPTRLILEDSLDTEKALPYRATFPARPRCARPEDAHREGSPGTGPYDSLYEVYYHSGAFRSSRRNVYHYLVIAEQALAEDPTATNGLADNFADEAARRLGLRPAGVHLGLIYRRGIVDETDDAEVSRFKLSASALHELGHALGLGHGGATADGRWDNRNFKPNYPSVMNWLYQLRGVDVDGESGVPVADFSRGRLIDLDETQLLESSGLGELVPSDHLLSIIGVEHLDDPSWPFNIDWNANRVVDDAPTRRDLNIDGRMDTFRDHDDWSKFLRDGVPGIGVNAFAGCGLTCARGRETIRFAGDFNGDGAGDVLLFTGAALTVALGNRDGFLRAPPSMTYRGHIGDWELSYGDRIVVGRFGEEVTNDRIFVHRRTRAALIDFNLQGAEVVWTGERASGADPDAEGPLEPPTWSFGAEDSVIAAGLSASPLDSVLVSTGARTAVLRWQHGAMSVVWHSGASLAAFAAGSAPSVGVGRRDEARGATFLYRGDRTLAEIDAREDRFQVRPVAAEGMIRAIDDSIGAWSLARSDCLIPVDIDGDGVDELLVAGDRRAAILRERASDGELRVVWRSDVSGPEWRARPTHRVLHGQFAPGGGEEVVVFAATDGVEPSRLEAFAWSSEAGGMVTVDVAESTVTGRDPEDPSLVWTMGADQRLMSGPFLTSERDTLLLFGDASLGIVQLFEDGFRTVAVHGERVDGWCFGALDDPMRGAARGGGARSLVLRANDVLGVVDLTSRRPQSSISVFDAESLSLRRARTFRRGDSNLDAIVDLTDALTLLLHLFQGGAALPCPDAADADDSGELDVSDAIRLLRFLFTGGEPIPTPGVTYAGTDPTPDRLECPLDDD